MLRHPLERNKELEKKLENARLLELIHYRNYLLDADFKTYDEEIHTIQCMICDYISFYKRNFFEEDELRKLNDAHFDVLRSNDELEETLKKINKGFYVFAEGSDYKKLYEYHNAIATNFYRLIHKLETVPVPPKVKIIKCDETNH